MAGRTRAILLVVTLILVLTGCSPGNQSAAKPVSIAVEFNNHAACAYVADAKGWFDEEGVALLPIFQTYESGAAIAAALTRGDIQIGYMGLTGAIMTYARGVPVRVIAGVHQYGYSLVAMPEIEHVEDLEGKTIGCLREGTVTDLLMELVMDEYQLENVTVLRMSPSEEVINLVTGRLDAALIPEHHATLAASEGYPVLIESRDIWPGMQGDVLVVRTEFMEGNPGLVNRLMVVTQKATDWINEHPAEAADIMARQLQAAGEKTFLDKGVETAVNLEITAGVISRSMDRIEYTTDIDPEVVQDTIDHMVELGYVREGIKAADILDLTYLQGR